MSSVNLINWFDVGGFVIGAVLTVAILMIGHWFPWAKPLCRIQRYTYGVLAIIIGFTGWRLAFGLLAALTGLADWTILAHELIIPAGLLLISVAGGVTVVWAYRRDDVALRMRQAKRAERLLGDIEE